MEYRSLFHTMLGLPETTGEPTPYVLLGVEPAACTRTQIEQALNERRKRLRQNIPDPRFIPIVLTFEKELENAAALLLDAAPQELSDERMQPPPAPEPQTPELPTPVSQPPVRPGRPRRRRPRRRPSPPVTRKPPRRKRLPQQDVAALLRNLPPRRPTVLVDGVDPETLDFYDTAVDLTINQGVLLGEDEHRLLGLATRLSVPRGTALDVIERRLALKAAVRSQADAALLKIHFANQLRKWSADGRLTQAEQDTLIQLARSQGLSESDAAEVLAHYLRAPDDPFAMRGVPAPGPAAITLLADESPPPVDDEHAAGIQLIEVTDEEDVGGDEEEEQTVIVTPEPVPVAPPPLPSEMTSVPMALPSEMTEAPPDHTSDWKWYAIISLAVALTLALIALLATLVWFAD